MAIQGDGKILVAGGGVIVRLNADGSLDPGFSGDGKLFTDLAAMAMAIQPDGRIVVAGGYGFRLARFLADGAPDSSFSGDGTATTNLPGLIYARAVALQTDGRIVVAGGAQSDLGDTDFAVVRYRGDGELDTSFGTGGKRTTGEADADELAAGVAIQANGKIVVAGQSASRDWTSEIPSRVLLARFGTSGAPDGSFGTSGSVTSSIGFSSHATAIALQPNGRIVLAGIGTTYDAGSSMLLARYHGDTQAANVAPTARFTFSCSGPPATSPRTRRATPTARSSATAGISATARARPAPTSRRPSRSTGRTARRSRSPTAPAPPARERRRSPCCGSPPPARSSAASPPLSSPGSHARHHLLGQSRRQARRADHRKHPLRPAPVRGLRQLQLHRLRGLRPVLLGHGDLPHPVIRNPPRVVRRGARLLP